MKQCQLGKPACWKECLVVDQVHTAGKGTSATGWWGAIPIDGVDSFAIKPIAIL